MHFTGRVRLSTQPPSEETAEKIGGPSGAELGAERVYSFYFHGPAYQVVDTAWRSDDTAVASLVDPLPDNHRPADRPLTTAPRLIELCFQAAGLWQAGRDDLLALPLHVGRAQLLVDPTTPADPVHARAREVAPGTFDCEVVDATGTVVARLDGYRTVPLPAPIADDVAADLHAAFRS